MISLLYSTQKIIHKPTADKMDTTVIYQSFCAVVITAGGPKTVGLVGARTQTNPVLKLMLTQSLIYA